VSAAVRDGKERGEAARIGGMDRQTLRDWVHRFNAAGPEGLFDNWTDGPKSRPSAEQSAEFAKIVEAGPDRERDGVVRWRRVISGSVMPLLSPEIPSPRLT
jgi:transposase